MAKSRGQPAAKGFIHVIMTEKKDICSAVVLSMMCGGYYFRTMATMKDYRDYWLHQCIAHPELMHADDERVFGIISIEEALGDFRSGAQSQGWIFRLIEPIWRTTLDDSGRYRKYYQGGYVVAKYVNHRRGGVEERNLVLDQVDQVNDDLIAKMLADSLNGHSLFNHSLDEQEQQINSEVVAITGDASYIGIRTTYTWDNAFVNCIEPLEPSWADGGTTPDPVIIP